jgi:hypothetical protein
MTHAPAVPTGMKQGVDEVPRAVCTGRRAPRRRGVEGDRRLHCWCCSSIASPNDKKR